jgi:hypothetical protein
MPINKTKQANLLRFLKQSDKTSVFSAPSAPSTPHISTHTYAISSNTAIRFSLPAAIKCGLSPADILSDPQLHRYRYCAQYASPEPVKRINAMFADIDTYTYTAIQVTLAQVNEAIANSPAPNATSQSSKNYTSAPITLTTPNTTRTFDAKLLRHVFRLLNRQTITLLIPPSPTRPAYAQSSDPKTSETVEALIMAMYTKEDDDK